MAFAQGPPIQSDTPILLGLEGRGAMVRTLVMRKSKLYQNGSKAFDPLNRRETIVAGLLVLPFNLTSDLLVGTEIPTINVEMKTVGRSGSSFGLGDASVFAKWVFIQVDRLGKTFRIAAKGTVKFPTGNENRHPPLGTGALDYSLGAVGAWIGKRYGVYAGIAYRFNGTSEGVDRGNGLEYNAALGFRVIPATYAMYPAKQVNTYLEVNGRFAWKDSLNDREFTDSGGNTILLSPGIQYIPSRILLVEASFQVPVVQRLNGTQLGTDFALSAGIRVLLF